MPTGGTHPYGYAQTFNANKHIINTIAMYTDIPPGKRTSLPARPAFHPRPEGALISNRNGGETLLMSGARL